jgi:hypothetical protein
VIKRLFTDFECSDVEVITRPPARTAFGWAVCCAAWTCERDPTWHRATRCRSLLMCNQQGRTRGIAARLYVDSGLARISGGDDRGSGRSGDQSTARLRDLRLIPCQSNFTNIVLASESDPGKARRTFYGRIGWPAIGGIETRTNE